MAFLTLYIFFVVERKENSRNETFLTKVGLPPTPATDQDPALSGRLKVVVRVARKALLSGQPETWS